MRVAELLDPLGVGAHAAAVRTDLCLGEDDTDLHALCLARVVAREHRRMVVVVMGVAGAGKTTVGQALARRLGLPFLEGDEFHSPSSIAKLSRSEPLTDDDR